MTSIAGVTSSSSSELLQILQQLARKQAESTEDVTLTQPPQPDESRQAEFESRFEEALIEAGLDPARLDEVRNEIRAAISTALSESNGAADPRELVRQAVEATLQNYGVDTDKLREQMKPEMGSKPPGPPPGGPGAAGPNGFDGKLGDALTAAGLDSSKLDEVTSEIQSAILSTLSNSDDTVDLREIVNEILQKYGLDIDAFDEEMKSGMESSTAFDQEVQGIGGTTGQFQGGTLIEYLGNTDGPTDWSLLLAGFLPMVNEQA